VVAIHQAALPNESDDTQRLSSGGAGGGMLSAPDEAICARCYPALTCNELLGSPLLEPPNVIFLHTQEPRNVCDPKLRRNAAAIQAQSVASLHSSSIVKTNCEATQRLSSGGAGGGAQAAPDKAS
jgi:hypothetical protein